MDMPEAQMYKTHGIELNGIDMEVIRQSSLGVEGWALHNFGDDRGDNISDYDDTPDLFPEHNVSSLSSSIPRHPAAPPESGGSSHVSLTVTGPGMTMARTPTPRTLHLWYLSRMAGSRLSSSAVAGPETKVLCVRPLRRKTRSLER